MALAAILTSGLVAGLVVLYLIRPRQQDQRLSQYHFFVPHVQQQPTSRRLRLESLLRTPPFYLQLLVLLLLLAAMLTSWLRVLPRGKQQAVGLWIALDTSASMSAVQGSADRMVLARREIELALDHVQDMEEGDVSCIALVTFDLAPQLEASGATPAEIRELVEQAGPRALGTNLMLVHDLLGDITGPKAGDCQASHLLVVTDLPAPEWVEDPDLQVEVIWSDVGESVGNVGLVDIRQAGTACLGAEGSIEVEMASYGPSPGPSTLVVTGPDGTTVSITTMDWAQPGPKSVRFEPGTSGEYAIRLSPGGAYGYDDEASIAVDVSEGLRVDWQMASKDLPNLLAWQLDSDNPELRVMPYPGKVGSVPTLLVGDAYGKSDLEDLISYFVESSPLLADLNLDVAESLAIEGIILPAGSTLRPVLSSSRAGQEPGDQVWIAASTSPLAAYVPGLPAYGEDPNLDAFSTTAFFNAVCWLMRERTPAELFTLTTDAEPIPHGTRIALHPEEGNTNWPPRSRGDVQDIRPVPLETLPDPLWPALLLSAALVFGLERALSVWGSSKWR